MTADWLLQCAVRFFIKRLQRHLAVFSATKLKFSIFNCLSFGLYIKRAIPEQIKDSLLADLTKLCWDILLNHNSPLNHFASMFEVISYSLHLSAIIMIGLKAASGKWKSYYLPWIISAVLCIFCHGLLPSPNNANLSQTNDKK